MKYLFYIALVFTFISCERQLSIEVPEFNEKLVVNAFVDPSEPFQLTLSKNVELLSEPQAVDYIGETRLIISEDGFVIHNKVYDVWEGVLNTTVNLSKNKTYEILLESEDYPVINAKDIMPSLDPEFELLGLSEFGNIVRLEMDIEDDTGTQFYMMELYMIGYDLNGPDTVWSKRPLNFNSSDRLFISNINTIRANTHFALFDDQLLNSGTRSLQVSFDKVHTEIQADFVPYKVEMEMKSLSKQFFDYYIELLENNHIYGGPLASPSFTGGNIEGGLGIFGCFTKYRDQIKLQ